MQRNDNMTTDTVLRTILTAPAKKREAALAAASLALRGPNSDLLLVNQAEAARILSVSKCTVWRMVKSGVLHPVKLLGAVRYPVAQLRQLSSSVEVAA